MGKAWLRMLGRVLGVAVLLTACSGGSQATGGEPSTISWFAGPRAGGDSLNQALIDAFERAYPSIKVDLIGSPSNTDAVRDSLRVAISSGQSTPDVYLQDVIWPATFGHDGLALPLDDRFPADFWNRFSPELVRAATYRGRTYATPFFIDVGLLYYRRDLLDELGLEVPRTWERLVQEAQLLQSRGLVKYGYVFTGARYEGLTCVYNELLRDAGGQVLDDADTRSRLSSGASLRALQFLSDLVSRYHVSPPEVATYEEVDVDHAFASGDVAFARNWNNLYNETAGSTSKVVGEAGVAALPTFADQQSPGYSTPGGWNLAVNPHTRHLEAALTFIRWLTDVPAQEIMASEFEELPTNERVRRDSAALAASPLFNVGTQPLSAPRPSATPAYARLSKAIFTNVNDAITGHAAPAAALRAADRQIAAALA